MNRTHPDGVGQDAEATATGDTGVRREPLDRRRILLAAVEFIDEKGLRALTMRRLGDG